MPVNEHQLRSIYWVLEKQRENAIDSQKKAKYDGRKEDEKYYMGMEDAYEIAIGKLSLIEELKIKTRIT